MESIASEHGHEIIGTFLNRIESGRKILRFRYGLDGAGSDNEAGPGSCPEVWFEEMCCC